MHNGLSKCGTRTTTGSSTTVYWCEALVKIEYKKDQNLKKNYEALYKYK
jgi:hypothetical protein